MEKIKNLFLAAVIGLVLYPPMQYCFGAGNCYPSGEHGWIFNPPFLRSVDYARLAIYELIIIAVFFLTIKIQKPIAKSPNNITQNQDEEEILTVFKPTLLKISEQVASFRLHGMNERDALDIIEDANKTLPKSAHKHVISAVKLIYKMPISDVEVLANNSISEAN